MGPPTTVSLQWSSPSSLMNASVCTPARWPHACLSSASSCPSSDSISASSPPAADRWGRVCHQAAPQPALWRLGTCSTPRSVLGHPLH
jgi:hypothetical protein